MNERVVVSITRLDRMPAMNETNNSIANLIQSVSNTSDDNSSCDVIPQVDESDPTMLMGNIFGWFVVAIGMVGFVFNGVVLAAFLEKRLRSHPSNALIIHQAVTELLACLCLLVSYPMKLMLINNVELTKKWGNAFCILFTGDALVYVVIYAATANLELIALERYFRIVHLVKHKNHFRM